MIVSAGTRLGRYEVLTPIGAGGMGEVYVARDTRLDRTVAIKVSKEQFSERFEREARAIAALNHPHICTLHDVGPNYLVMELVEGETLASRLKKGRLSIEDTLLFGRQIADALAAAHAKGIIHRDLKPGNIMIARSGVKVLDFGLAKSTRDETLTVENAALGTPAYMAPEQVEGKECDARSDIYSFGLVLREMASGTRSQTLDSFPQRLGHVIARCLDQDPDNRWQSAKDVKFELEWVATTAPPRAARPRSHVVWAVAAGLMAAGLSLAWLIPRLQLDAPAPRVLRLPVNPPAGGGFLGESGGAIMGGMGGAISPDGRLMVFVVTAGGADKLWVRTLDALKGKELPGTDGARYPFWSPDSRSVAFFAAGKLNRIDVSGGLPAVLCDSPSARGGSWSTSDVIVFSPNAGPLQRVPASGGNPIPATRLDPIKGENSHRWPHFLPGGRRFLYFIRTAKPAGDGVYLGSLDRLEEKIPVMTSAVNVTYAPGRNGRTGHLLWVRDGRLLAQPFDPARAKFSGEPGVIAEGVLTSTTAAYCTASNEGTILYARELEGNSRPFWYSRDGKPIGAAGPPGSYGFPAISPDGNRIAVVRRETSGAPDIWVIDSVRPTPVRLTLHGGRYPVWSPDGRRVAFLKDPPARLAALDTSGSGREESLSNPVSGVVIPHSWSPDGKLLLYTYYSYDFNSKTRNDLWLLSLSDRKLSPFLQSEFQEIRGRFSPDAKWISYTSDESGHDEIYIRSFPADGTKRQVSSGGGDYSQWRQDGREIFYRSAAGKLMSVAVKGEGFSAPEVLFEIGNRPFDVAPDGQRVLVLNPVEETEASPMVVLVNWEELLYGARK